MDWLRLIAIDRFEALCYNVNSKKKKIFVHNLIGKENQMLMLKKSDWAVCIIPLIIGGVCGFCLFTANPGRTKNIEVRATTGIYAENKLGGIEFAVSDRWNYHRIIFQVWGFDEGLKLNNVVCYGAAGKKYDFNKYDPDWNIWTERFSEVLQEATIGKKPE